MRCFGWDALKCGCGGKRTLIVAVQKRSEIERFLRHLKLWPTADDVVSVHGPPEVFDFEELEREAEWDEFYESQAQLQADADDWAA